MIAMSVIMLGLLVERQLPLNHPMAVQSLLKMSLIPGVIAYNLAACIMGVLAVQMTGTRPPTLLLVNAKKWADVVRGAALQMRLDKVSQLRLIGIVDLMDLFNASADDSPTKEMACKVFRCQ